MILRTIGWGLFFLLLAFICGLLFSSPINTFFENNVTQPFSALVGEEAAQAMQNTLGITLPASSTGYYFANQGSRRYWIRMQLGPSDLNGLFRGSSFLTCNFPFQDNFRPVFEWDRLLDANQRVLISWWSPQDARSYIGGECTGTDYKIFRMFTDTTNAQGWIFYMEVIQL